MPTATVNAEQLLNIIGKQYSNDELSDLCFDFGLELDGEATDDNGARVLRIETPANRPDLLSVEGIGAALHFFRQPVGFDLQKLNHYCAPNTCDSNPRMTLHVSSATASIRPFCFAAIVRHLKLNPEAYQSIIDLQDRLHHNLGRRRQLVAIGTHDLSTISGDFYYDALPPKDIRFVPLNQSQSLNGDEIMELYETHSQLKHFLPIIRHSDVYPVIRDSKEVVLSLPPIINGDHSKISVNSTDILIEVTATDYTKGFTTLNTVVNQLACYSSSNSSNGIEQVKVSYDHQHPFRGGQEDILPDLSSRTVMVTTEYLKRTIGMESLTAYEAAWYLRRMMLGCHYIVESPTAVSKNYGNQVDDLLLPTPETAEDGLRNYKLNVTVPYHRTDIMHPCDIAEDVAIAYGYNRIKPTRMVSALPLKLGTFSDGVRSLMAHCGYREALTWGMCAHQEFEIFNNPPDPHANEKGFEFSHTAVKLSNPKTRDFEVVRSSLLPGLLKALMANQAEAQPIRLFEIGDVVWQQSGTDTGAASGRQVAALYSSSSSAGLEHVQGMLELLLRSAAGVVPLHQSSTSSSGLRPSTEGRLNRATDLDAGSTNEMRRCYELRPVKEHHTAFLQGRCAEIILEPDGLCLGRIGMLHPLTLKAFSLTLPTSVFEISLQTLLEVPWFSPSDFDDC